MPLLSTRALLPISFATIKVNIYEHTQIISEMENESMQRTFHLISKYEEESLFSSSELDDLSKQNKENIEKLRTNFIDNKKKKDVTIVKDDVVEEIVEEEVKEEEIVDNNYNSYINLSSDRKDIIMKRWNSIDFVRLDKDIDKGKDILAHNYTITYGDDALAYIYRIRDEYDILIEYLIRFNNEKKGIINKTVFSDKIDNEWRYLNNYIKVLEKIRDTINR